MDFHNLAFLLVLLLSALGCCAAQDQAISSDDKSALVGQNVSFPTIIDPTAQDFVTISWTFNSGDGPVSILTSAPKEVNVNDPYKGRVVFHRTNGSLVLIDVQTSDSGDYSINMVTDVASQIPGEAKLTVYEPISDVVVKANVTEPVEFNDTVSVECSASGSEPKYKWLLGDVDIVSNDHLLLNEGILTISNILRADEGPFTCIASNPLSENTSSPLTFDISYGPENIAMTKSPQTAFHSIGANVTLTCSAMSSPPAEFEWFLNGESLKKTEAVLTLEDLQVGQDGNYSCMANNPKTMRFLISDIAQINLLERISEIEVTGPITPLIAGNSSANISCQAAKGAITTTVWLKDGAPLSPSDRVTILADKSSVGISPVEKTDKGVYKCTLSNAVSEDSASYTMTVNYGPENVAISGQNKVKVEDAVALTCSASSDPPATYTWIFNGTQKDVTTAMYTIERAVYLDNGNYTCVATNNVTGKDAVASHKLDVDNDGLTGGAIAGIVIGVLVALVLIALIAHCMTKNKKVTESPY